MSERDDAELIRKVAELANWELRHPNGHHVWMTKDGLFDVPCAEGDVLYADGLRFLMLELLHAERSPLAGYFMNQGVKTWRYWYVLGGISADTIERATLRAYVQMKEGK